MSPKQTTSKKLACNRNRKIKMQITNEIKPTPEMIALASTFKGAITKIPTGKRVTRGPSKKPGESGSVRHVEYSDAIEYKMYGGDDQH
jgi:hypothetical protein